MVDFAGADGQVLGITLMVYAKDLDNAAMFYVEELGWFRRTDMWGKGWLMLRGAGRAVRSVFVCLTVECSGVLASPAFPVVVVDVPNVAREFKRLSRVLDSGGKVLDDEPFEWPVATQFRVAEPSGNVVLVEENRGLEAVRNHR